MDWFRRLLGESPPRRFPSPAPPILERRFRQASKWPGETIVLRGGVSLLADLELASDDPDFPDAITFSVQAHPDASEHRLLVGNDGEPLFPYGKYRTTTLAEVRQRAPEPDRCLAKSPVEGNDLHCNVLGLTPEAFESILSIPPKDNPKRRLSVRR